jgi:hypothetical protein
MFDEAVHVIGEYEHFAREHRQSGNLTTAGLYYVATAHGNFMRFRRLPSTTNDNSTEDTADNGTPGSPRLRWPTALGISVVYMTAGGLCFRLADAMDRSHTCCTQGTLFLQDILDHESADIASPQIGLYHEMIGDLRLVGGLGDHDAAYERAHERYRTADSDLGWSMEDDFDDVMQFVLELADSVDYGISEETWEQIYRLSLEERITFKRDNYPTIINRVLEDGNWDSDIF